MVSELVLPKGVALESLLEELRGLCWSAADILLSFQQSDNSSSGFSEVLLVHESEEGPVSSADIAVNDLLMEGIRRSFPTINWELLSEETSKENCIPKDYLESDWLWIIDPLDGTKDFLQGTGDYAVHIALVFRNIPILGVVLIPSANELWFGLAGKGTWCENREGLKTSVQFSKRKDFSELILISSKNHRNERLEKLLDSINFGGIKTKGSVGCKVASILKGEADIYISISGKSSPKDWDMAAPEAILLYAGGNFTHADGRRLEYKKGDFLQSGCLIASHGLNHKSLCKEVKNKMNSIEPSFLL